MRDVKLSSLNGDSYLFILEQLINAGPVITEKSTSDKWEFGAIIGSVIIADCVQNYHRYGLKKVAGTGC